jgi:hypothetical protein
MIQPGEIVNLFVTTILLIYFITLIKHSSSIMKLWFSGVLLMLLSQISTIIEGFIYPSFFNFSKHFCFTCSCILFFIGALQRIEL